MTRLANAPSADPRPVPAGLGAGRGGIGARRRKASALAMGGVVSSCMIIAAGAAVAQGPLPGGALPGETLAPRFSFAPVEGGALKLDRETGRVSLCTKRGTGFTCEAVPDTRDAYEAEIARLQAEIATLRRSAQAVPPSPVPPQLTPPGTTPGASELDQAFDYAERFYRRLKGMIDEWRAPSGRENL